MAEPKTDPKNEPDERKTRAPSTEVSYEGQDAERDEDGGREYEEDGYDVETHGGGQLEGVPGFGDADGESHALTEGFPSLHVQIEKQLAQLPRSCDLEYGEQPESVCGRDDRIQIRGTTRVPWRMVCQLIITRRDGAQSLCTGWFIGPGTVMTAGHCVYSHTGGGWAHTIEVIPGMNASHRPYGSQTSSSLRTVRGWTASGDPEYDYGAIILPDGLLGQRVGWFGFAALAGRSLRNLLVNNSGYAGDKPFGTQWYNAGRITRVEKRRLFYMVDTYGGHSGSPVWRLRNGKRHAVGVHAYGGCPNKATRITKDVFDNMKAWKRLVR